MEGGTRMERAMQRVIPVCPRCGRALFVTADAWKMDLTAPPFLEVTVSCVPDCGWVGRTPLVTPIPEPPTHG